MTVKNFSKYQTLAKILNVTFGNSALTQATQSLIFKLLDEDHMSVLFLTVANFPSDRMMEETCARLRQDGLEVIKTAIKTVAERYKEQTGDSLKIKLLEETVSEGVEFLTYQTFSSKKSGYFRLFASLEMPT